MKFIAFKQRITTAICCLLIASSFIGCGSKTTINNSSNNDLAWTIEDFYIYDADGKLYNYPNDEEITFYDNVDGLGYHYEENGGEDNLKYYTKRSVGIRSIAKMAFSEYDLSGFYAGLTKWPTLGSLSETEKNIEKNFFETYLDLNEAVRHTNEIQYDLALYLSAEFQVDEKGNVVQLELDEKGTPIERDYTKDTYKITFYIRDDKVFEWSISHRSSKM